MKQAPQPVAVRILRSLITEADKAGLDTIPVDQLRDALDKAEQS